MVARHRGSAPDILRAANVHEDFTRVRSARYFASADSRSVESATLTLALTLLGFSVTLHILLFGAAMIAAWRGRTRSSPARASCTRTRFSVLKPLAGEDDDLRANLESFTRLSHPEHEIVFGVASPTDPAARVVREFLRRFPEVNARLVFTDARAATNPKVAQLIGLAREASGDVLVISDSNVRVRSDYLESLERELSVAPAVALVTSLFVGTGERSFGAALENVQLTAHVAPSVAASALLSGRSLTVGKSMAITRDAIDAIGGFGAVGHVLAEDHLLGRRVRETGRAVRLCFSPVENRNVECDVTRTLERHTRWAKMRRAIAPQAFVLEPLADPLLVAFAVVALVPCRATWLALAVVVPWKMLATWLATWLLRGRPLPLRYLPIELARSALAFVCWSKACASRHIVWRGHPFVLGQDSTITPAPPRSRRQQRRA